MGYPLFDNGVPLGYYGSGKHMSHAFRADGKTTLQVTLDSPDGTFSGGATVSIKAYTSLDGRVWGDAGAVVSNATGDASGSLTLPMCRYVRLRHEVSSGEHLYQAAVDLK